jgi:transcriptional regulator with AbiEi antitoxin domain of type IV toxin-antitoxin system
MLIAGETGLQIRSRKALEDAFLGGYEQVLRPDLWIGVFRPVECDPDALLRRIKEWAAHRKAAWAVTGGQAAFALKGLPRAERVTVFLESIPEHLEPELKLSVDEEGSVTLLRSFGTSFPWRTQAGIPISHPLLIYAELLHEGEPKSLEAAAHIRRKYFAK